MVIPIVIPVEREIGYLMIAANLRRYHLREIFVICVLIQSKWTAQNCRMQFCPVVSANNLFR